jgi:hypothetical protein
MRNNNRQTIINNSDLYEDYREKRGLIKFTHYSTPVFKDINVNLTNSIINYSHIWREGDHYYKLADLYYNDAKLWWVIAFYNRKPTEQQINIGDTVLVPTPIEIVLQSFKV